MLFIQYFAETSGSRLRSVTDYQIECSGSDFTKSTVAIERNGDRDRRIFALEFHSARDQHIIKLVDMERPLIFTQKQCTGLRDRPVGKPVADRLDIRRDRRDISGIIEVGNRIVVAIIIV